MTMARGTSYYYERNTSRLKSAVDEKGQFKVYQYYPDDNLQSVAYPNAQTFTPAVSYAYDPNYDRLVSMQDGIGMTTWSYNPVGVLGALLPAGVTGPWANQTVSYGYDSLRRANNRAINNVAQTATFDALGRVTNVVNALGSFGYDYDGATARVLDAFYPNGQSSHFSYFDDLGDRRLQQIIHQKANASLISSFSYAYNPAGEITNWVQQLGALAQSGTSAMMPPASYRAWRRAEPVRSATITATMELPTACLKAPTASSATSVTTA